MAQLKTYETFLKNEDTAKAMGISPQEREGLLAMAQDPRMTGIARGQAMHQAIVLAGFKQKAGEMQSMQKQREQEAMMKSAELAKFNDMEKQRMADEQKQRDLSDYEAGRGTFTPQRKAEMNTLLYGHADPMDVEVPEEGQDYAGGSAVARESARLFGAGLRPKVDTLIGDDTKRQVAQGRAEVLGDNADLRAKVREKEIDAKLAAKDGEVRWVTNGDHKVAIYNGQMLQMKDPKAEKQQFDDEVDQAEKDGIITPAEKKILKRQRLDKESTRAPSLIDQLGGAGVLQQGRPGAPVTGAQLGRFNPSTPAGPGPTTAPVRISTKQEYDALPSGARYIDPQGNISTKK